MKRIVLVIGIFLILTGCSGQKTKSKKMMVFVSILPQKYFVERIAGKRVQVETMIQAGQSPTTYEPIPRQMVKLSRAVLFFRIGVPFESAWIERIQKINPNLEIVDTRRGIDLRKMDRFEDFFPVDFSTTTDKQHTEHAGTKDPHIWISPKLVKIQVATITRALIEKDPVGRKLYLSNELIFDQDLDILQKDLKRVFQKSGIKEVLVFHPSWGYLLDEFGIRQIPIEIEGKSPTPSALAKIIQLSKQKGIRTILVQKQFSSREAQTIADAIGGKVLRVDPLAENYLDNLRGVVSRLTENAGGGDEDSGN